MKSEWKLGERNNTNYLIDRLLHSALWLGCAQTGTSIVIRGKGSVKEGRIGTKDGKPLPGADEPLHAYITSDVEENVKKGVDRVKIMTTDRTDSYFIGQCV